MTATHPNAFKMEAEEKRRQAAALLAEADALDPTPEEVLEAEEDKPKKKK